MQQCIGSVSPTHFTQTPPTWDALNDMGRNGTNQSPKLYFYLCPSVGHANWTGAHLYPL
jgi:hypothetical protein